MSECILVGKVKHTKAGIKMPTLYDVEIDILTFNHITEAKLHDQNSMDAIPYQTAAYYVLIVDISI